MIYFTYYTFITHYYRLLVLHPLEHGVDDDEGAGAAHPRGAVRHHGPAVRGRVRTVFVGAVNEPSGCLFSKDSLSLLSVMLFVDKRLNRFLIALVGAFNTEKALLGLFSEHCETSRRFVDSSSK